MPEQLPHIKDLSDTEIAAFLSDTQFLRIATSYGQDSIPLSTAIRLYIKTSASALPARFRQNALEVGRIIHEIARTIGSSPAAVYPTDVQLSIVDEDRHSKLFMTFSQIECLTPEITPLTTRRTTFNEDDIRLIVSDLKKLACLHAYAEGLVTLNDVKASLFEGLDYPPRGLAQDAFASMAIEIASRIQSGSISIPPFLKQSYPGVYGSN